MSVEWWQLIVTVLAFVGTGIGVAIRIGYIVANTVRNITIETDAKIGRVFERFDKYKDFMEGNFVRKEACQLTHSATTVALEMAAKASSEALTSLKVSVEKLEDKVDTLLMRSQ